ncbi:HNH endonuclease family protein [Salinactinospora qingdaonensis]|uniref:GmrSD restriction endonucleases C-terminal domain-containing protein n=1 Tax=Salinactinospora qingdaonensis TaxID=702744 RepID=A0ABP7F0B5_9ACTN
MRRLTTPLVAAAVVLALTACGSLRDSDILTALEDLASSISPKPSATAADPGATVDVDVDAARALLASLATADAHSGADYERDEFGSGWVDTDDNGCDTRDDVLARDLEQVRTDGACEVLSGVLDDPYTGERIAFAKEEAHAVHIDHVVPLALAWRMGADEWEPERRVAFANDPANLLAVDGPANQSKSDSGPAEWGPTADFHCSYAVRYIEVLADYELPVPDQDRAALSDMLDGCA